MIWIIASIPFWALSAFLFLLIFPAMIHGTFSEECVGEEYHRLMAGGTMMMILSGLIAVIAAKLCS